MPLQVLITNFSLAEREGTQLYVRDLAMELCRQGHQPAVYTSRLGDVSDELTSAGISVTDSLRRFDFEPDIIHGHHTYETLAAISRFRSVPAIFVCHGHADRLESPPMHARIIRYFGVSSVCIERLRTSGIPADRVGAVYNFVDTNRFKPRPPLPDRPQRALVFSNYAKQENFLPAIAEACEVARLELTIVGKRVGNPVTRPEEVLGDYDIVFAKAKAAMEAMAVGCAVVLCDFSGLGPMVASDNFDRLRPLNFGFQALTEPHTTENVLRRIECYDAREAELVRDKLRSCAGLETAAAELVDIYQKVIADYESHPPESNWRQDAIYFAAGTRCRATHALKRGITRLRRAGILTVLSSAILSAVEG